MPLKPHTHFQRLNPTLSRISVMFTLLPGQIVEDFGRALRDPSNPSQWDITIRITTGSPTLPLYQHYYEIPHVDQLYHVTSRIVLDNNQQGEVTNHSDHIDTLIPPVLTIL